MNTSLRFLDYLEHAACDLSGEHYTEVIRCLRSSMSGVTVQVQLGDAIRVTQALDRLNFDTPPCNYDEWADAWCHASTTVVDALIDGGAINVDLLDASKTWHLLFLRPLALRTGRNVWLYADDPDEQKICRRHCEHYGTLWLKRLLSLPKTAGMLFSLLRYLPVSDATANLGKLDPASHWWLMQPLDADVSLWLLATVFDAYRTEVITICTVADQHAARVAAIETLLTQGAAPADLPMDVFTDWSAAGR